jgi:hypothetical protein
LSCCQIAKLSMRLLQLHTMNGSTLERVLQSAAKPARNDRSWLTKFVRSGGQLLVRWQPVTIRRTRSLRTCRSLPSSSAMLRRINRSGIHALVAGRQKPSRFSRFYLEQTLKVCAGLRIAGWRTCESEAAKQYFFYCFDFCFKRTLAPAPK